MVTLQILSRQAAWLGLAVLSISWHMELLDSKANLPSNWNQQCFQSYQHISPLLNHCNANKLIFGWGLIGEWKTMYFHLTVLFRIGTIVGLRNSPSHWAYFFSCRLRSTVKRADLVAPCGAGLHAGDDVHHFRFHFFITSPPLVMGYSCNISRFRSFSP